MEIVLPHFLHPSFSGKFVKVYRFHLDPSGDFDNRHDLEGANSADMKLIDRKQLSALRKHPDLSKFRLGAQLDDEDEQTWKHSVRKKNGTIINQPQRNMIKNKENHMHKDKDKGKNKDKHKN
nr:hypothetical protein BaRGS_009931 [Batillaria attramentaria]